MEKTTSSFKNGNIKSLTLINFQTFKNTTINFSSSLNFIIGPNGSGKSTISNALSFIFGGNPKTIGKAKHLKEYIRFGEEKCKIEATIFYNNKPTILTRSMSHTANSFYIDGLAVKKNVYDEFISKLRININNLCQYLPQERVSEFARMTPEELLVQTCMSLDKDEIVQELNKTREMESRLSEVSTRETVMNVEKTNIKSVVENIYKDVEKINERESKLRRVELMETKKIWLEYEEMKSDYKRLTSSLKMLKKSVRDNSLEYEKVKTEVETIRRSPLNVQMTEMVKSLDRWDLQIKGKIDELKLRKKREALLECDLEHLGKRREKSLEEIKVLTSEIETCEEDLEKAKAQIRERLIKEEKILKPLKAFEPEGCKKKKLVDQGVIDRVMSLFDKKEVCLDDYLLKFDTTKLDEKERRLLEAKRRKNSILDKSQEIKSKFDELEDKKKKIKDEGVRRLELLKRYHYDTYRAVVWYRENKQTFKDEIVEPAFLTLNITNEKFTAEIETFLSHTLMTSFICKDPQDFEKFMKVLKDNQRLAINAIEAIKKVEPAEYSSSQIKSFGFDGTLLDFIDVCKETKDFLIAHGHFDAVPVSKSKIDEKKIFQTTKLKRFAMDSKYCEIKRSRYNEKDFVISSASIRPKNFFTKKIDTSEIDSQLRELSKTREEYSVELKSVYQEIESIEKSFKDLVSQKNSHDSILGEISTRVNYFNLNLNTLNQKRQILSSLKDTREIDLKEKEIELDIERAKQEMVGIKNSLIGILRDEEYVRVVQKCMETYKNIKTEYKKLDFLENNLGLLEKSLKELNNQIEEHEKVKKRLKGGMQETAGKLKERTENLGEQATLSDTFNLNTQHTQNSMSEQMKLLPNTVEDLNLEITREKTQLKFISVNEEAKQEYEDKKTRLDKISSELSEMLKDKKACAAEVEKKRSFLIKTLNSLTGQINKEFQGLFSQIGCEGRVEFYHKDVPSKNWRLNILVKFREKEGLEVLSSFRQSGGEKSVSTILYLLALQKIDSAPFRLVDEINQGMDKHNEKSILNILFEMCRAEDSPQFFIISPKLVEGLTYNESMKVIVLFSDQPGIVKKAFMSSRVQ